MLYLDRRLTWGEDADLAISQVREYISKATGDDPESIVVEMPNYEKIGWTKKEYSQELYFPTWKIDADHPLVEAGVAGHEALFGKKPVVDKWTFSTNLVATTGRHKIPAIGFGLLVMSHRLTHRTKSTAWMTLRSVQHSMQCFPIPWRSST